MVLHGRLIQSMDDALGISGRTKCRVRSASVRSSDQSEGREKLKHRLGPHGYVSELCRRYNTLPVIKVNHPSYAIAVQVRLYCTVLFLYSIAMSAPGHDRPDVKLLQTAAKIMIVVTCYQLCARYQLFRARSIWRLTHAYTTSYA